MTERGRCNGEVVCTKEYVVQERERVRFPSQPSNPEINAYVLRD